MIGEDDEDDDTFDPTDADAVTALAANLRAMGQNEEAVAAAAAAMELRAEAEEDAPAAWEVADKIIGWFGDDYAELLMERLGSDLTDNLIRAEQLIEDLPDGDAFRGAVSRGDRREAFNIIVKAAELSKRHRIDIEPTGYSRQPEPPATDIVDRMDIQARIDALYAEFPPGTREHSSASVQNRLQALFVMLAGNEPIRGQLGPL